MTPEEKELEEIFNESKTILEESGITPATIDRLRINPKTTSRFGRCRIYPDGRREIEISEKVLSEGSHNGKLTVMIHEMLHALPGCADHRSKWKHYAEIVNMNNPNLCIKRTNTYGDIGIKTNESKYVIACTCCGAEFARTRLTKAVQHPENYVCGVCGGKLKRIK